MRYSGKGQYELLITTGEFVMALALVMVIYTIVTTVWNPYEQTAFANAEMLRLKMEDVCALGAGASQTFDFEFPQAEPITAFGMPKLRQIMPGLAIRLYGDPKYVLYYWNFPPGEGVMWESYLDLPQRLFVTLNGLNADEEHAGARTLETLVSRFKNTESTKNAEVIFSNVVLGGTPLTGNIGNWTENSYKFSNWLTTRLLGQTSAKYLPCSKESALCLKTNQGIYALPLTKCKGKIENIIIKSHPSTTGSLATGKTTIFDDVSDFNIVSPCKTAIRVTFSNNCDCSDTSTLWAARTYTIYSYDGTKLEQQGTRTSCLHRIGGVDTQPKHPIPCLIVELDEDPKHWCTASNYGLYVAGIVNERVVTSSAAYSSDSGGKYQRILIDKTAETRDQFTIGGMMNWAWP